LVHGLVNLVEQLAVCFRKRGIPSVLLRFVPQSLQHAAHFSGGRDVALLEVRIDVLCQCAVSPHFRFVHAIFLSNFLFLRRDRSSGNERHKQGNQHENDASSRSMEGVGHPFSPRLRTVVPPQATHPHELSL
jgi:hypothetical protein